MNYHNQLGKRLIVRCVVSKEMKRVEPVLSIRRNNKYF